MNRNMDEWVTVSEAIQLLEKRGRRTTRQNIHKHRRKERFGWVKKGNIYLVNKQELLDFMETVSSRGAARREIKDKKVDEDGETDVHQDAVESHTGETRQDTPISLGKLKIEGQPLVIDFYNLHLGSGPQYDRKEVGINNFGMLADKQEHEAPYEQYEILGKGTIDKVSAYPDEHEKVKTFLKKHFPKLDSHFGLEWYERQTQESWFSSKGFMRFADDHHYTRQMINEYMEYKGISIQSYRWLYSKLLFPSYIPALWLMSENGHRYQIRSLPDPEICQVEKRSGMLSIGDYSPYISWLMLETADHQKFHYYGIKCLGLQHKLSTQLIDILRRQIRISKCSYSSCKNIFIRGSGRYTKKYCSDSHRVMAFRQRRTAKITTKQH